VSALKSSVVDDAPDEAVGTGKLEGVTFVDFLDHLDMSEEATPASPDTERTLHHGHRSPMLDLPNMINSGGARNPGAHAAFCHNGTPFAKRFLYFLHPCLLGDPSHNS
jgi:hypothetical protein